MKKSLALIISATFLVLGGVLIVQHARLVRQKVELATARTKLDEARRETDQMQASKASLEMRHRELQHELDLLSFRPAPVQQTNVPAEPAVSSDAPTAQDAKEGTFGGFLSKMMSDPDTRKFIRDQQRQMMDTLYDPLIKRLGLTSEQATAFKDFLADTQMQGAEKATSLLGGSATNRAEVMAALTAERKQTDEQIKAFLGDAGYAQYQDYQQTLGERAQLNQFRMQNAGGENPITDQQAEQLLELMKQEKQNVASATGQTADAPGQDQAKLQGMMSPERMEKMLQTQEAINQRVYERAQSVLSPDQMQTFGRFQTNQLQTLRLGMSMARKFFAPEAGGNGVGTQNSAGNP